MRKTYTLMVVTQEQMPRMNSLDYRPEQWRIHYNAYSRMYLIEDGLISPEQRGWLEAGVWRDELRSLRQQAFRIEKGKVTPPIGSLPPLLLTHIYNFAAEVGG